MFEIVLKGLPVILWVAEQPRSAAQESGIVTESGVSVTVKIDSSELKFQ